MGDVEHYFCCQICGECAPLACSRCRSAAFCSARCQSDAREYGVHDDRQCSALANELDRPLLPTLHASLLIEPIGRQERSDRNIFDAIAGYDVYEQNDRVNLGERISILRLFYEAVKGSKFWEKHSDGTKNFTVFAPTNDAMLRWIESNGVDVHERPSRDSKSEEIDISETIRLVQQNDQLQSILLGHFIGGIWPISTGLESGPDVPGPTGIPRPRTGLKPLVAALTLRSTYSTISEMPERKWFKKRFKKIEIRRTIQVETERKRVENPGYAGIRVKFELGEISADIIDDDQRPLRPQNGYVYIIDEVLGDLPTPVAQPQTGSICGKNA